MTDATFQPGDVVRLKSGGPAMTIRMVKDDDVVVDWFSNVGTPNSGVFPLTSLSLLVEGREGAA